MALFGKKKTTNAKTIASSQASTKMNVSSSPAAANTNGTVITSSNGLVLPSLPLPPALDPVQNPVAYLKSLPSIRERSQVVFAERRRLRHFHYQDGNLSNVVKFVVAIIKRDYGTDYASIPPHGRWQHFEVGGRKRVDELIATFGNLDRKGITRRIIDLFLVSVLLDAGAGNKWSYKAKTGRTYRRSEGLAVASIEMFEKGMFSSDPAVPTQVDALGLDRLSAVTLGSALQVSDKNPMSGLEGRSQLLVRLGSALSSNGELFGSSARPGNIIDYLLSHPSCQAFPGGHIISATVLWSLLIDGLSSIWPAGRTQVQGQSIGDAWPYAGIPSASEHSNILPFHKLTQWLAYSLMAPMTKLLDLHFAHSDYLTGLPEYRNGGLFIDLGVLTLQNKDTERGIEQFRSNAKIVGQQSSEVIPLFEANDDVIVEWRAMTVCLLDQVHAEINKALGLSGSKALTLPQVLEAGTWKAGREIAEVQRPNTRGSPIGIISDGTVF